MNNMTSSIFTILLFTILQVASAALNDVYAFTLYANGDEGGKCRAQASIIGDEILATFDAAVPGFTPYEGDVGTRLLRSSNTNRDLQVKLCTRTYCEKPANWDWCMWNGCNCSCGGRRLETSVLSGVVNDLVIGQAKKQLDDMLQVRGAELGCEFGLEMKKVRG